ncbi:MAG: calcium-binding protein [Myxococcales bacterium]|nr:calcium-binding protein [Myxococcales bacterium]
MNARHLALALLLVPAAALVLPGCDAERSVGDGDGDGEAVVDDGEEKTPRAPNAVACSGEITEVECTTADGEDGFSLCLEFGGEEVWTECGPPNCWPGENWDYGCTGEVCTFDGERLARYSWSEEDCITPLVVAFDDAPLTYEPAGAAAFDISGRGECLSTDWPSAPWLALDRDGDGVITDGRELFGDGTRLAAGGLADHGFAALAELDSDGDGAITAADPAFAELVLWSDSDGDRRGELRELTPIADAGLVAIRLDYVDRVDCDARGNCGKQRARFDFRDGAGAMRSGEVVDVYLSCQ